MGLKSISLKDVDQHRFVKTFARFLKKTGKLRIPEWIDLVKTSLSKELAPYDADWYYIRCAALLRHIYLRSPVGVGTVSKMFSSRNRRGTRPSRFCRSSPGLARKCLQSLEALKLIEKSPDGGRKLTSQGQRDVDRIAGHVKSRFGRAQKIVKKTKPGKAGKGKAKASKTVKTAKTGRPEKTVKPGKTAKPVKAGKAGKTAKPAKTETPASAPAAVADVK